MSKLLNLINSNALFDSHSHFSEISIDQDILIDNCINEGVMYIVDVAVDTKTCNKVLNTKNKYPNNILNTAGIHPEILIPESDMYLLDFDINKEINIIDEFIKNNGVDLIGECGIDFYYLNKLNISKNDISIIKDNQIKLFIKHLELAKKYSLPITIHSRESEDIVLKVVKDYINNIPIIILHSYTGSIENAFRALDMGIYLGVNGIITYKSAENIREIIRGIFKDKNINNPKDLYNNKILLETDSPLLIPRVIKSKEKENTPLNIITLWNYVYNLINVKK